MESVLIYRGFFGGRRGALAGKRRTLAFGVLPLPHLRTHSSTLIYDYYHDHDHP